MNFVKTYNDLRQILIKLGSSKIISEAFCRVSSTEKLPDSQWIFVSFVIGVTVPLFSKNLLPKELWLTLLIASFCLICRWRFAVIPLVFSVGVTHVTYAFSEQQNSILPAAWQKTDIVLHGRVVGLPKTDGGSYRFTFEIDEVVDDLGPKGLAGKRIQLSCYRCPRKIETGQSWIWSVRLKQPRGYSSIGAFDYEKFLFRNRIVASGYVRINEKYYQSTAPKQNWRARINQFRAHFRTRLDALIADSQAGNHFLKALVIGDKSAFTNEERDVLQKAGLSHLVAISGLHVGLMFFCTAWLVGRLSNLSPILYEYIARHNLVVAPAWLVALAYSALAGFSVSTQRAMLMLSIFVVVRLLGREASLMRILILTAFIVLILDPFAILDGGFWLSFTAVLIIAVLKLFSKDLSLLKLQLSLWIGMMPLTSLMFGFVSIISPLINLVAVPIFSLFIIPVSLLLSIGVVALEVDLLIGCLEVLSAFFECMIIGLEFLNQHISMVLFTNSSALILGVGCLICFLCLLLRRYLLLIIGLSALYFGISSNSIAQRNHEFTLWLLDVGQGLSIVYRTHAGVSVYDTGPKYPSGFSAASAVVIPFLEHLGVEQINRLIVSHADNDHIGGASKIMDRFPIKQILTSRVDKFDEANLCEAGQSWSEGLTELAILSPSNLTPTGSNNRSCVLKITHDEVSILLTGDIEKEVERQLLRQEVDLSADVLLVPHQGSKTSSTQPFVEAVNPEIGLIAAGYLNHYRHPHDDVVNRYSELDIKLLSTIEMGTIELRIIDGHIKYSGNRQTRRRPWHWREMSPSVNMGRKLP